MNRPAFFAAIRPAFGGRLQRPQVAGIEGILDAATAAAVTDPHHAAHVLAHVRKETGDHMSPIKETVMPHHKDKNPTDAEVIRRLDAAWAKGQLPWVKTPYWRDGAFGRGPVQITHWRMYEIVGKAIGEDLRGNPDLALDPQVGAKIAVIRNARWVVHRAQAGRLSLPRGAERQAQGSPPPHRERAGRHRCPGVGLSPRVFRRAGPGRLGQMIQKPWLIAATLAAVIAAGGIGFRIGAKLERAEVLREQTDALEAVRVREKRLMKDAERVAEIVYQENQDLAARADRADRAVVSLRAEIARRAGAAETGATTGADGSTAEAILADCAGEYRAVAGEADRLRAKLLGLQAYVRDVCDQ
jgi:hypothetical protein